MSPRSVPKSGWSSNPSTGPLSVMEAINSDTFRSARQQYGLVIPLGVTTDGNLKVLDLVKAPHVLCVGSVTSGKTKFVNSLIASLVKCYPPHEVQLLLDDVTRVELVGFNGLKHLVRPVVIDLEETLFALDWLANELATRFQKMSGAGFSNIEEYNQKYRCERMPYLVYFIYELSDLMVGEGDIGEPSICQLATSGPAAGVHIILATQRPEPQVLTAALKARFPVRVCFNLVSIEDSKVVLDIEGAEKLNEKDEMLYFTEGLTKPESLRGCSISDEEIEKLVSGAGRNDRGTRGLTWNLP
jgi:DNA segregation ATPase FtsK/SpoIIIE, S-DNA-T family